MSSVDLNPNLFIDKFNYRKALLEGSAARSIQELALTKKNYAAATDILQKYITEMIRQDKANHLWPHGRPLEDTPML